MRAELHIAAQNQKSGETFGFDPLTNIMRLQCCSQVAVYIIKPPKRLHPLVIIKTLCLRISVAKHLQNL